MTTQKQYRQQIRRQRRGLSTQQASELNARINRHIQRSPEFQRARRVAGYIACDGEVSLANSFRHIFELRKTLYLPILDEVHHNRLWFAPYKKNSSLHLNHYGIPEPVTQRRQHGRALALNLLLTPLVGFDKHGHRLGMGGGYYDKSLAFLSQRKYWHRPIIMGVAYSFQEIPSIKKNEWDIPLNAIVTENGITYFD
jgi:5-formyltetrahydrofolate cyclo-ligase